MKEKGRETGRNVAKGMWLGESPIENIFQDLSLAIFRRYGKIWVKYCHLTELVLYYRNSVSFVMLHRKAPCKPFTS